MAAYPYVRPKPAQSKNYPRNYNTQLHPVPIHPRHGRVVSDQLYVVHPRTVPYGDEAPISRLMTRDGIMTISSVELRQTLDGVIERDGVI